MENIYVSKEGGGAGNNWGSGYTQAASVEEQLLDMLGDIKVYVTYCIMYMFLFSHIFIKWKQSII